MIHKINSLRVLTKATCLLLIVLPNFLWGQQRQMEHLSRGIVAVRNHTDTVFVSWRLLGTDPSDVSFNLYRKTGNLPPVRVNSLPISEYTWFKDAGADFTETNAWYVRPVLESKELPPSAAFELPVGAMVRQYLSLPLQKPKDGEVFGEKYTYSANDASVGDLDGDGEYEIILKWEPSNAKNPPQKGFTGNQIIDAYKMDGTLLWRIDLGRNIRSAAAYTQFLVYDLDGDGKAEIIFKTADGTIDGQGKVIGDGDKDWRTLAPDSPTYGKIVHGPEYLTVFDGITGAALATVEYIPNRYPLDGWGGIGGNGSNDSTGGRADRFTAGIAYLDGNRPSAVFVRGWYGRTAVAAWDWRDGKLTNRWIFDSQDGNNPYSGMANHSLSIADVDGDGKDEICVGAMTIDNNGAGLYTTGLRHGDALHLTDMDPSRPGLEVFGIHENEGKTMAMQTPGVAMFDAATGEILFSLGPGADVGRGVSADIDPTHRGYENWGGPGGLRNVNGQTITEKTPSSTNFVVWWDGDLTRELLDKNRIDKWDWNRVTTINLLTADGCVANNGTKATPCLSADLFGDWREEVIWRTEDSKELRIYTTTIPTSYRFYTLMHDPQYRLSIAWQNVAYNQPPHPGYYFGAEMKKPPMPDIYIVQLLPSNTQGELLFANDFEQGLDSDLWIAEIAPLPESKVHVQNGKLVLDTKGGVTVWLNMQLKGNIQIEYTRKVILDGGKNDRISDLNQFWMAEDIRNPDLFTRTGNFEEYDSLRLYYAGIGGNTNTTTRFRKYDGNGEKILLQEHTSSDYLLQPNKEYRIKIIVKDGITSLWVDDIRYFSYHDVDPLLEGYFGFRSTWSRQEIDDFKIYRLD